MLKIFAMTFALLGYGAAQAQETKIDIKVPGYTEADVQVAIDQFRRNCRPLGAEFWGDVEEISAQIYKEYAEHRLARGWTTTMSLALKFSRDPKYGPAFASGTGVLAGQTLHYDLGGGITPGFLAIKRSSQYLCGLAFSHDGDQLFVPVEGLKFLDR